MASSEKEKEALMTPDETEAEVNTAIRAKELAQQPDDNDAIFKVGHPNCILIG